MQNSGFYSSQEAGNNVPKKGQITDIPVREPEPKSPRDLPPPRHRPGEPILYDHGLPMVDPTHSPLSGLGINDPLEFK